MTFNRRLALIVAGLLAALAARAADPRQALEAAIQAKGGHERLHGVHSLAVFMKPAQVVLAGAPETWLCVFPDRYFEWQSAPSRHAMVVDATANRVAIDANGFPRSSHALNAAERDRLVLNQLLYLLESSWLQPAPIAVRHNVLTVQAGGLTFDLFLNKAGLPERVLCHPAAGDSFQCDYRLQQYRSFQGIQLPARMVRIGRTRESIWDVDYEVNARFNPKLFERMPDLADGPEPWRK